MIRARHVLVALAMLQLAACGDSRLPTYELSGSAMGTTFSVILVAPGDGIIGDPLEADVAAALDAVDALASTWRDDSELNVFNTQRTTDWVRVSAEFCGIVEQALEVSRLSDGAFDITVGPLVNLWGFGPGDNVREPPADDLIEAALARIGYRKLATRCEDGSMRKLHPEVYVDLSGWAKGFAVDRVAELLDERGASDYLVEIGGEIRVRGQNAERKRWAIAVEAPSSTTRRPHSVLRVTNTSVATSGDYRNYFEHGGKRYSHTIDPRTGRPVAHALAAVTVLGDSAAFADAMATALLVLGPDAGPQLAERLGVAGYFLVRDETGINELATTRFDGLRNL